jgi:hypothetical protein
MPVKKAKEGKILEYEKEELLTELGAVFSKNIPCKQEKLESSALDIEIREPSDADMDALMCLGRFDNPLSFQWVVNNNNGESLLEDFVQNHGQSLYGEFAIQYLAFSHLAKGNLEKAQKEFEKIKFYKREQVAEAAKVSLMGIDKKKACLEDAK